MGKEIGLGNSSPFYTAVVEDRNDPEKLGRVRVRVLGIHDEDTGKVPTADLPWAPVVLPATNPAASGVGWSPNGLVPGSWVWVYFADGNSFQQPVVLGSMVGVNQATQPVKEQGPTNNSKIKTGSGGNLVDSSGTPVTTGTTDSSAPPSGWALGQTSEKYETSSKGPGTISTGKGDKGGKSYGSYQLASTNGMVQAYLKQSSYAEQFRGMTVGSPEFDKKWKEIAGADAENFKKDQHDYIQRVNYDPALNRLKGLGLESKSAGVLDCIWSTAVQYGPGKCASIVRRALNDKDMGSLTDADIVKLVCQSKKENVGVDFKSSPTLHPGLASRFESEQKDLLKLCGDRPTAMSDKPVAPTKDQFGDQVYSGPTFSSNQSEEGIGKAGFVDPNGIYPKKGYLAQVDTNKLARAEKLNSTIWKVKTGSVLKGVEPTPPYNAKYPFNKVFESESGHVVEIDDTAGAERIHVYHRSGSFVEFHPDGTIVKKSIKDDTEIVLSNKSVYVVGTCNIVVEGNTSIKTFGNLDIQAKENIDIKAGGNINMVCGGDLVTGCSGENRVAAGSKVTLDAPSISQNGGGFGGVSIDIGSKVNATLALADQDEPPAEEDSHAYGENNKVITDPEDPILPPKEDGADSKKPTITETPVTIPTPPEDKFSRYYTLADVTTGTALSKKAVVAQNGLTEDQIKANLKSLAVNCLDPIAEKFGKGTFIITSGFREGQGKKSHHCAGCAADLQFPGMAAAQYPEVAQKIRQMLPKVTQIILEYHGINPVIHVAYAEDKSCAPLSSVTGNAKMCFTTYTADFAKYGGGGFYDKNRNLCYA
jgi:hypothetical protein